MPRGRGLVVLGLLLGAAVLIALAVVALQGVDDDSPGGDRAYPAAVRSDPGGSRDRIEIDAANFQPVGLTDGLLLVADVAPDGTMTEVRAIDPASGDERWTHDATAADVIDGRVYVVTDGELVQLDAGGKAGTATLDVGDGAYIGGTARWVTVYADNGVSLVDPDTLKVLAENVTVQSCSDNGTYCTRIAYDNRTDSSKVSLVEVRTGKRIGKALEVDGLGVSFALDDGKVVAVDGEQLVVHDIAGTELDRADLDASASLEVWFGERAIVVDGKGAHAWSVGAKLRELARRGPSGAVTPTARDDAVIVTKDKSLVPCTLGNTGFDCHDQIDGTLVGIAADAFYVRTDAAVEAYDLRDTKKPLWSLDIGNDQQFVALDGKVALTSTSVERGATTIDLYG